MTFSVKLPQHTGGGASVFDNVGKDDLIMAFFPCIRFTENILLYFQGNADKIRVWDDQRKLEYCMKLHTELHEFYLLVSKMAVICLRKGVRLIIENPWAERHYLRNYWCLKPGVIDKNRRLNGDYYKKPTQFYFVGCKPEQNFIFEPLEACEDRACQLLKWNSERQYTRSMIHPQYARRFIKMYLIDQEVAA